LETKSNAELKKVAASLKTLREDANHADEATKTKQELDALRTVLEEALTCTEGRAATKLAAKKRALDSLNLEQLEIKNKEEWELIRAELNVLKEDLRTRMAGEKLLKKEIAEFRAQIPSWDDSTSTDRRKEKNWKKVFTRFRRGKDDDNNSLSSAATPAAKSVVSAKSAPKIKPAVSEPNPVQTTTIDNRDDDDDADDESSCEVVTISPPSVLKARAKAKAAAAIVKTDSEDEGADDLSVKLSMKSKLYSQEEEVDNKSFKSTKSARSTKSAHTSNSNAVIHSSPSAHSTKSATNSPKSVHSTSKSVHTAKSAKSAKSTKTILSHVDVDSETGEITVKPSKALDCVYEGFEEEKKTDDVDIRLH